MSVIRVRETTNVARTDALRRVGSRSVARDKTKRTPDGVLLFWCEKRDLNPYGVTTRPSNVRVCQFRHSRVCHRSNGNIYIIHFFSKMSIPFSNFFEKIYYFFVLFFLSYFKWQNNADFTFPKRSQSPSKTQFALLFYAYRDTRQALQRLSQKQDKLQMRQDIPTNKYPQHFLLNQIYLPY